MGLILRILLVAVLIWIVWRVVSKMLAPRDEAQTPRFEATQRCTKCGTHVPREQLDAAGLCPRCAAKS